jgi:RNA polymerase sigma-70 factor (ECF subfamily)
MTTIDENDVRRAHAAGEHKRAIELTVRLWGPTIASHLHGIIDNRADAEEAFSEWAESLLTAIPGFEWQSSLKTYLFAVAYYARCNMLRRRQKQRRREGAVPTSQVSAIAAEVWFVTVRDVPAEVLARVNALRQHLTPDERSILLLRVDQGLSWDDVARVLPPEVRGEGTESEINARLRTRFKRLVKRLDQFAKDQGLKDRVDDGRAVVKEMARRE